MWRHDKVSFVLITKDDESTIRDCVEEAFMTGYIDEVLVIDLGSDDRTLGEVSYTKARIASAHTFEEAMSLSLLRSTGELVVYGDPKMTVPSRETVKLLPYSEDMDLVFTSRMSWIHNATSSREKPVLRQMNKICSYLNRVSTVIFDDISSPMFLMRKEKASSFLEGMERHLMIFNTIVGTLDKGLRCIQIPVEFHSEFTEDRFSFRELSHMKKTLRNIRKAEKGRTLKKMDPDNTHEDDDLPEDPVLLKRRIASIKRRLGAFDKPDVDPKVKKEIDSAIDEVTGAKKRKTKPRKTSKKSQKKRSEKKKSAR